MKRANRSLNDYNTPVGHAGKDVQPCDDLSTHSILDKTFTVRSILKELHLEKYVEMFDRHEIDLFVFGQMTADELDELGIEEDDREILLDAIESYDFGEGSPYFHI